MVRIRDDFDGTVDVRVDSTRYTLSAGDVIPEGARVGGHLTDTGEDVGPVVQDRPIVPVQSAACALSCADPLNDADAALAAELGIDGSPDWVRGYLACAADLAGEPETPASVASDEFDPSTVNAPEVHAYITEHPDKAERVLALERAGKARKGILDAYADA